MSQKTNKQYQQSKDRRARDEAEKSQSGRDISPLPEVVNPHRRQQTSSDFEAFARIYFPATFSKPWSNDHRKAIARIQEAVISGGLFAYAMPRGSGKTSLAEAACLWATITGKRQFVLFIGSDEGAALQSLESLKTELETNDLLLEDFPEVAYPIRQLDGIAHRCNGQLFNGKRTHIGWTAKEIVYPLIPGSAAASAIIKATGITGRIRGMSFKRPDGGKVRPDLVVIDDPQTDESAKSPSQSAERERILSGAVLGLAGPGKKIAGVMPCTVIAPGDMADSILDRQKHPEWQGERTKLIYSFPTNEKLWNEYANIRADSLRAGNGLKAATDFYAANREVMDAGAEVAWPQRFNPDEASAIQHAMNLKLNAPFSFAAEYQNEPIAEHADSEVMSAAAILEKVNGVARRVVPAGCDHVVGFIDVQGKVLYWMVAAFGQDFTGSIIDYGSFPDQKRSYFALADVRRTLAHAFPKAGQEGQVYQGLESLTVDLYSREWKREDGAAMRLGRTLVDAGWGPCTDVVYQFCRQSPHASLIMPSHGRYVGAGSLPWDQYTRRSGEMLGHHWMLPAIKNKRAIRHALIDVNYWKSFLHSRLAVSRGDRGGLTLWGGSGDDHRMLSEHLTAEYRISTEGRGRKVDEWKPKPGKPDNHLLDCAVGCLVAASMSGCSLIGKTPTAAAANKRAVKQTRKVRYL